MQLFSSKKDCCGCGACAAVCPKNCIAMIVDEEGFLYPVVDATECISCGMCTKICVSRYAGFYDTDNTLAYIAVSKETVICKKSSSGGVNYHLMELLLADGYHVCGAIFDENLKVRHEVYTKLEDCMRFLKSKYVQSDVHEVYEKIGTLLRNKSKVLFTGTPCQCAALYQFLGCKGISTAGLLTVDLICHGVPSQEVFNSYIREKESVEGKKIVRYSFRHKLYEDGECINSRCAQIEYEDGSKEVVTKHDDAYLKAYYSRLDYRPSCGMCKFARPERVADITIGDAWEIERLYPEMNAESGISLLMFHTEKGKQLAERLQEGMRMQKVPNEWAVTSQELLRAPVVFHLKRDMFFRLRRLGMEKAVWICTRRTLKEVCKAFLKKARHMVSFSINPTILM